MGCAFFVAGARVVGAVGRGSGSSNAGSAGRCSRVRVGTRALGAPPAARVAWVAPLRGASEARRSPSSGCHPSEGCRGPPPTYCARGCAGVVAQQCPLGLHAPWGLQAAGVVVVPAPALQRGALASRRRVLWGRRGGVRRGCPSRRCGERLSAGASPFLAARLLGGLPGSATRVLWAGVCEYGGPALSPWLLARGVAFNRCGGRPVSGAVPPPAARPLGRAAGAPRAVCPGRRGCGRGGPAPVPRLSPL